MKCPHCNGEHPDNYQFCPIGAENRAAVQGLYE